MITKKNIAKSYFIKLKKNGALYTIVGSFTTKFISLFGSIFLIRIISKQDYGVLSYYENFVSYFQVLIGLGMATGLLRYIVLVDSKIEKKAFFEYALKRGTIINIVLVLVFVLLCWFYPHPSAFNGYLQIPLALILIMPFQYYLNSGLSTFRALFKYKEYALLAFLTSVLLIIARVFGAWLNGITGSTYARLFAEVLCALSCVFFAYVSLYKNINKTKLSRALKKRFNQYSLQVMLTDALWVIFMLNDVFLLGQCGASSSALADYKVAYVVPANLAILTSAIGVFVAPYFTKKENEKDYKWVKDKLLLVLMITTLVMGFATITCAIFAPFIIEILYGTEYLSAVPVMRILLIAAFFNSGVRFTLANAFSAMGLQKANLIIAFLGMIIQIILDLILIPRYGSTGVAWASVAVYLAMGGMLLIIFIHKYILQKKR